MRTRLLLGFALLALGACAGGGNDRGCLGGGATCSAVNVPAETQSSSVNPTSQVLSCSATAYPSQIMIGQSVTIKVDTYGGSGNKTLTGRSESFASSVSIVDTVRNTNWAGRVFSATLTVKDSVNATASCSFSLEVIDSTQVDGFGCKVEVAPNLINPGSQADFTFSAINAPGAVTFSQFQANTNWLIPDANLKSVSTSSATTSVKYDFAGTKIASVVAKSGTREVLCRKIFKVGTPNDAAATSLTGCNVETAPLGYSGDGTQASMAGTITRIRAIPNGGTGPYTLTFQGADNTGTNGYKIIGSSTVGPSQSPQALVKFLRPFAALVKAQIKDSTGATASCQSYHLSNASDYIAVAAAQDPNASGPTGPAVKVFKGAGTQVVEQFPAFEGTYRGGVRVAVADFDGDGISDTLAATSSASGQRIRAFKGTGTNWFVSKPTPTLLFETVAGFAAGSADFAIGAGDINGDGKADIAAATGCVTNSISKVRVLNGADTTKVLANFDLPYINGVNAGVAGIAVADIDADGYSDIIISTCKGGSVVAYSGKNINDNYAAWPTNTLLPTVVRTFVAHMSYQLPFTVAAADVNNDGNIDIIAGPGDYTTDDYAPNLKVFSGTVKILEVSPLRQHRGYFQVAATDTNGDGYADLVSAGGTSGQEPSIELQDGASAIQYGSNYGKRSFNPIADFRGNLFVGAGG